MRRKGRTPSEDEERRWSGDKVKKGVEAEKRTKRVCQEPPIRVRS